MAIGIHIYSRGFSIWEIGNSGELQTVEIAFAPEELWRDLDTVCGDREVELMVLPCLHPGHIHEKYLLQFLKRYRRRTGEKPKLVLDQLSVWAVLAHKQNPDANLWTVLNVDDSTLYAGVVKLQDGMVNRHTYKVAMQSRQLNEGNSYLIEVLRLSGMSVEEAKDSPQLDALREELERRKLVFAGTFRNQYQKRPEKIGSQPIIVLEKDVKVRFQTLIDAFQPFSEGVRNSMNEMNVGVDGKETHVFVIRGDLPGFLLRTVLPEGGSILLLDENSNQQQEMLRDAAELCLDAKRFSEKFPGEISLIMKHLGPDGLESDFGEKILLPACDLALGRGFWSRRFIFLMQTELVVPLAIRVGDEKEKNVRIPVTFWDTRQSPSSRISIGVGLNLCEKLVLILRDPELNTQQEFYIHL